MLLLESWYNMIFAKQIRWLRLQEAQECVCLLQAKCVKVVSWVSADLSMNCLNHWLFYADNNKQLCDSISDSSQSAVRGGLECWASGSGARSIPDCVPADIHGVHQLWLQYQRVSSLCNARLDPPWVPCCQGMYPHLFPFNLILTAKSWRLLHPKKLLRQ